MFVTEGHALSATPSRPRHLHDARFWCHDRCANFDYDTIKQFKDSGLRLFLVGYDSGNEDILKRIKKGVPMDEMCRFTKTCPAHVTAPAAA